MVPAGDRDRHRQIGTAARRGDTIIDGGNTFYGDDMARSAALAAGIDPSTARDGGV
jgi:6-phosphogluconate dehydrogenase (decarboxylating)